MNIKRGLVACGFGFAYAGLALATPIIDTDRDSFIDATTGLEWMDLGVNNGHSYNQAVELTQSGGLFEEWRVAETNEVYALWNNLTVGLHSSTSVDDSYFREQVYDPYGNGTESSFEYIFDIIGFNEYLPGTDTFASLAKFQGYNGLAFVEFVDRPYQDGYFRDYMDFTDSPYWSSDYYYNESAERYSTFLVRETTVSEPGTLGLLCLALVGIGFVMRRKAI